MFQFKIKPRRNLPRVLVDIFGELLVVESALFGAHGDRVMDGVGQFFSVPGVDNDAAVETLRGTSELGQDHGAVAFLLAGNVLVGHEVHAITCRRNQTHVGNSVQSDELVEGDRLVHEVDRHEFDCS